MVAVSKTVRSPTSATKGTASTHLGIESNGVGWAVCTFPTLVYPESVLV